MYSFVRDTALATTTWCQHERAAASDLSARGSNIDVLFIDSKVSDGKK